MNDVYQTPSASLKEVATTKKHGNPIVAMVIGLICFIVIAGIATAVAGTIVYYLTDTEDKMYDLTNHTLGILARMVVYTAAAFIGCCVSAVWSQRRLMPLATGACIIAFWVALSLYVQGYVSATNYLAYALVALSAVASVIFYRNKFKPDDIKAAD